MSNYACGIGYSTVLPVGDVHDWLDDNCAGDFHIQLADMNEDAGHGYTKKVEIFFENESDRDNFRKLFKVYEQNRKAEHDAEAAHGGKSDEKPKKKGLMGMLRPDRGGKSD
jgi:hypothetical protein